MQHQTTPEDKNISELKNLILTRKFDEAEDMIALSIKESQIIRILHNLAEHDTGLLTYTFVNYLIQKHPSAFWHKVAACIASESLDHVLHGNNAGLFHILEAIKLDSQDYLLKEYALGFYSQGLLPKEQALFFAQDVLKYEPNNKLALKISLA